MEKDLLSFLREKAFDFDTIAPCFPSIMELAEIPQNPEYHGEGNVYRHTKMACDALKGHKEWQELPEEQQAVLYLAVLFHDIGKKTATRLDNGQWVSPGHSGKGEKAFRTLCYRQPFSLTFDQREAVAGLIRFHGLPVWLLEKRNVDKALLQAAEAVSLKMLYLLSWSDITGRVCNDKERLLYQIGCFQEYARERACYEKPYLFSNLYSRYRYFSRPEKQPDMHLFDITEFDVYVMSGLPLAGKDTYIVENLSHLPVVSLDAIRDRLHIRPEQNQSKVIAAAMEQARSYLRAKTSFVWNATNIIAETRSRLCDLFANYGARVNFIYVEAPYIELLARNYRRERTVPEAVINRMLEKMEMVRPWEGYSVQYKIYQPHAD